MANTRVLQRSFAGGEMSPEMFGRIDDVKYQSGAARLRNMISKPQGAVENRPGFRYVRAVKNSAAATRLIPFTFSTTQTMVIELGAGYFRFHTNGATLESAPGVPYEIVNAYAAADLFDIHYVQSADVLTLVHPNYPPAELRRLGALSWTFTNIAFTPLVTAPASCTATPTRGATINISSITLANPGVFTTVSDHLLAPGVTVYISGVAAGGMTQIPDGSYVVNTSAAATTFTLKSLAGGAPIDTTLYTAYTTGGNVQIANPIATLDTSYVITTVAANGIDESPASTAGTTINNLYVSGAFNTITWPAVVGALRYNVYKSQSGLYGYIGQTTTTSFIDDNIAPNMGQTPPIYDAAFGSAGNYPGAVSYFEQRRCFAGTTNSPQQIWLTRSGTESDLSYSLPIKDSDRISFRVAAREANTIRHIIPLTQLLALTSSAEWRVSSVNSDAITPVSVSVRPQSYVGANNVQPSIINNALVYCAARGGHVRELGYNWQANGYITGDLSLRAAHLFDNKEIVDMTFCKAPQPLLWFVSNDGKLLGLTYVPDQQIGAWHWHDTDGVFESCTSVAEGTEDVLYVIVRRVVNGATVRYVERMETRQFATLQDSFFVDSGLTYDGTNVGATTMTLTGGVLWDPSETLTLTSSVATFAAGDINDAILLTDIATGLEYRATIRGFTSTTVVSVMVDKVIPVALRGVATTVWAFARNVISGLSHLEGKTVSVLCNGDVHPQRVVTAGSITLLRPESVVHVGLQITADLQTLPVAMQIDGFGQGRMKNVNKGWLRVYNSSGIFIGPNENQLVEAKQRTNEPYGTPPALKTQEIMVMTSPSWADSGQIFVRQVDPLPLTIVSLTLEVAIGG